MASSNSTAGPDYQDPTILLSIIKPEKGSTPPAFGAITFDETIIQKLLSGSITRSPEPKLIVLCGPPGSGKSTIKKSLLEEQGITNYIDIDPDEIRTILTREGVKFNNVDKMRGITNAFNKRMSDQSLKTGLNIVFDTTGQNFMQVSSLLRDSKGAGYETTFAVIWASLETCKSRVNSRNAKLEELRKEEEEKGEKGVNVRIPMDIGVAETIYNAFKTNVASNYLITYPVDANNVLLYDNDLDNRVPDLLLKKEKGTVIQSKEKKGFYNMDLHADGSITKSDGTSKKGAGKRKTKRVTYRKNKRSKTKRRRNKKSKRHIK